MCILCQKRGKDGVIGVYTVCKTISLYIRSSNAFSWQVAVILHVLQTAENTVNNGVRAALCNDSTSKLPPASSSLLLEKAQKSM